MASTCAGDNAKLVRKTCPFNQSGSIFCACMKSQVYFLESEYRYQILDFLRYFCRALVEF